MTRHPDRPLPVTTPAFFSRWPLRILLLFLVLIAARESAFAQVPAGARYPALGNYDWFWMIYEYDRGARCTSVVYRPLYLKNTYGEHNSFTAVLMPLVYWEYEKERSTEWKSLFGLAGAVDYVHPDGVRDYDLGVFPFLLYGSSSQRRDSYLHVWPFGGTIRGKLGQDRITTCLFPGVLLFLVVPLAFPPTWTMAAVVIASLFPLWVDYESKDYKAWGILWPLIQRGTSPNRDDFRVLPLYAHNSKKNRYDSYSVLMIFNYQKAYMREDEETTLFVFPLYGRRWTRSGEVNSSVLLWPFFSWGYNKKTGDTEINFPWPLVQVQDCRDPHIRKRVFFPFYGTYEFREQKTLFVTPLYFTLEKNAESLHSEEYYAALIFWYFKRDYKKGPDPVYGRSWRYFKVWPLFQYEHDDRGNASFNLLSLLLWRDPEGYERLYQPFWTLFEYRRMESGEKRLGLLLRTYYQRWGKDFMDVRVPLLFTWSTEKDKLTKCSFLLSMFSYADGKDGRTIRLFWIPIRLGEGTRDGMEHGTGRADDRDIFSAPGEEDFACTMETRDRYGPAEADKRLVRYTAKIF